MGYFSFPHTRTYDSDLGWLIRNINEVNEKLSEYLENAVISFADPITWNITKQYPALTMVIDSDGTAYLSRQPVPAGVDISNTDYWMPIFNYADSINEIRSNIALNTENSGILPSNLNSGSVVWFQGNLYQITANLPAGAVIIPGSNADAITFDAWVKSLLTDVDQELQNLSDRINTEVTDRTDADNVLSDRINVNDADIAELKSIIRSVDEFGCIGDGVSDDTTAFQDAIDTCASAGYILYVPKKTYLVTSLELKDGLHLLGANCYDSVIQLSGGSITGDSNNDNRFDNGIVENLRVKGDNDTADQNGFNVIMIRSMIKDVLVRDCLGTAFYLPLASNDWYQSVVENGERHGLMNCNALRCGRGFYLRTQDAVYNNLIAARCDYGVTCGACDITNLHIWGYNTRALEIQSACRMSNIQVEAATVPTPNTNIFITGSNIEINNLYVWNVRVTNSLIYCSNAHNLRITNAIFGASGSLNQDVPADRIDAINGTGNNVYIDGVIDNSYISGYGCRINGSISNLIAAASAITGTIQPTISAVNKYTLTH